MKKKNLEAYLFYKKSISRSLLYLFAAVAFALASNVVNSDKDEELDRANQSVNSIRTSHDTGSES